MNKSNPLIDKSRFIDSDSSEVIIGPGARESVQNRGESVSINVVRAGNDVKYIEVQCECGKITRIECEYE